MTITEAIRALRKQVGLTQQQLAVELKLAVSSVARYEAGNKPEGRILYALYQLAAKYEIPEAGGVFLRAAEAELGQIGNPKLVDVFERVVDARSDRARGKSVDVDELLATLYRLCLEMNPALPFEMVGRALARGEAKGKRKS